ncbi:MBL fold metallo-hydrolase [Sorangium sp. So ce381]|uniref:MBL fold metallo-hydrolase n=1 Tax=Sorangium sp. So ce381 TaxID=3133307 RepID=UPI003F5B9184
MSKLIRAAAVASFTALAACASEAAGPSVPAEGPAGAPAAKLAAFTSDAAGFDTRSYYYDTGREVVVFDAQFTGAYARSAIAQIRSETQSPITYVVVTHPNPDKFNGASEFQKIGAKVVASRATAGAIDEVHAYKKAYMIGAGMFTEETYPPKAVVDVTFEGAYSLPLQAGAVELRELEHAGVSTTQTVAIVPSARALVVGDLVHHKAHAWLEGGIRNGKPSPDLASWRAALDELLEFDGLTVYGGRGQSAPVRAAVDEQKAYLTAMESIIERYVASLGEKKSELSGAEAPSHHKKIAALASAEFPDYDLAYMIEYGVYGLANAIASK